MVELRERPRTGWAAVAPVAAASFTLVLSEFIAVAVLPSLAADLHVSEGDAGLAVVLPGLVAAVAAPAAVLAANRTDRRLVLLALTGLLAVSNLLAGLAPSFTMLLVARALLGVAVGAFWTIGVAVAPRLVPAGRGTAATALVTAGISAATVVSLPAGHLVAQTWGWRWALLIVGALAVLITIWQVLALPSMRPDRALGWSALTSLFRSRRDRTGLLLGALLFFAHFGAYTFITPFLTDRSAFSSGSVTLLLLGFGVAGLAGNFGAGAAVTRNLPLTLAAAAVLLGGSVALLTAVTSLPALTVVLVLVWGASWGAVPLIVQAYMMGGTAAEGGLALFVSTTQLFLAAGSALGGQVVDRWGLSPDYLLFAIPAVAAAVVARLFLKTT
ncbi:MFS transporter [Actinoplanes sp. NPDC048796]|uniref:MFS transporter n=1 Tax=Actinoplanes sp. NPDC048796 TaxID=3155640 RepID=UPI0033EAF405